MAGAWIRVVMDKDDAAEFKMHFGGGLIGLVDSDMWGYREGVRAETLYQERASCYTVSLMFSELLKHASSSGRFNLLYLLPRMLFPWGSAWLASLLQVPAQKSLPQRALLWSTYEEHLLIVYIFYALLYSIFHCLALL